MRIYQSTIEAAKELARELKEMGIQYQSTTVQDKFVGDNPDFITLELTGYSYCINQWEDLDDLIDHMELNREWVYAEEDERLGFDITNKNPGYAWKKNKSFWEQFLRDGFFSYSYPERWQAQVPYIIQELKLRPNTRQAVMSFYESTKDMMNWGGRDRVPCSLTYHFLIRDGKLNLIYTQRSCDYALFYGSDVFLTIRLLDYVAKQVGVECGSFFHQIGSLHCFKGQVKDLF
jgi:thymidylate synthase